MLGSPLALLGQSVSTQQVKLTASDPGLRDQFGDAVAFSGDVIVVGSPFEEVPGQPLDAGAAYVFFRNQGGPGKWGQKKKLKANDGAEGDQFGAAVSLDGQTMVVGAYNPPHSRPGAAYVFERNAGGPDNWGQVKKLVGSDTDADDEFGWVVAVKGDTIVIGSHKADGAADNIGAAYVFQRDKNGPGQWGEAAKLIPADGSVDDNFGESLGLSATHLVVGSYANDALGINSGAAYVYALNTITGNTWDFAKKLLPTDGLANDQFGISVAVDGERIVVGANLVDQTVDTLLVDNTGAAYVFERNALGPDQWGQVTKLMATTNLNDHFGIAVAIAGDLISVASHRLDQLATDAGMVFQFERNTGGADQWGMVNRYGASDPFNGGRLGECVAMNGQELVAGAAMDGALLTRAGAAYVFGPLVEPPVLSITYTPGHVTIHWEPFTPGFVLQFAPEVPYNDWQDIDTGAENTVIYPAASPTGFYRMIKRSP